MKHPLTRQLLPVMASLLATLLAGCATAKPGLFPPAPSVPTKTVYVIRHGWHTGLGLRTADLVPPGLPVAQEFPNADYLEIGWGDAAFYPAANPGVRLGLKALFWPTPSVLQVVGVRRPLTNEFPDAEILAVKLSEAGFAELQRFVANSFDDLKPVAPGLYGDGWFYPAKGKFYFPKLCNRWTADGLRAAGCPIASSWTVTAGSLLAQTRKFGTPMR